MTNIYPSYYKSFACIGSACRHNCCIGWEIDIDRDTYEHYMSIGGEIGERLRSCMAEHPLPHFVCRDSGRCPFLNGQNLCDIIITLGEGSLCRICDAHPRFTNELPGRREHGLGLCCEEAARLILGNTDRVTFVSDGDDSSDDEVLLLRDRLIGIFQDRSYSVECRCRNALDACGIALPKRSIAEWAEYFLTLERLDSTWSDILIDVRDSFNGNGCGTLELYMKDRAHEWEQLLVYLIWRHTATAADTGDAAYRCAFAVLSYQLLRAAAVCVFRKKNSFTFDDMAELCRLYSAEVEYSTDNTEAILDELYFFCEVN